MLTIPSREDAKRLREFLTQAGYTEDNLRVSLKLEDLPSSRLRNLARLHDRTAEPSLLNILVRWFWIGMQQDAATAEQHVPSWFTHLALECGLLTQRGGTLSSEVMLFPTDGFVFAADHTHKIDSADPDLVLWPNPTSRLLSRLTVRRPSRATLDLGTGNGIQALKAAAHSDVVVATDLNRRAVGFAAFNALLNGIENVECLAGDAFDPVAGRNFDLIVSNPPFFITPAHQYLFCDNRLDLDGLCCRLVREAPTHLHEGGYFQMLCEWAEVQGQSWKARLQEWLENVGCDAWVMKGYSEDPSEYAEERIRSTVANAERDAEIYDSYMGYYRERKVLAIHGGAIVMRRRSGHNWTVLEELAHTPKAPFGESIVQAFVARDLLQSHASDDQLLDICPRISEDVRLEQVFRRIDGGWERESLTIRRARGFEYFLGLQPIVAEFLSGCDGTRNLGVLVGELARKVSAPYEQVKKECLDVTRKLIERGFLVS